MSTRLVVSTLSALVLCAGSLAQDAPPPTDKKVNYSPYPQQNFPNRVFFGDFDPFGDFDLLFGAAKLTMKIVELPIRYRDRVYGITKISRFRHGLLLLRMSWIATRKLKFS